MNKTIKWILILGGVLLIMRLISSFTMDYSEKQKRYRDFYCCDNYCPEYLKSNGTFSTNPEDYIICDDCCNVWD